MNTSTNGVKKIINDSIHNIGRLFNLPDSLSKFEKFFLNRIVLDKINERNILLRSQKSYIDKEFTDFHNVNLYPDDRYVLEMLKGYHDNLTLPDEKFYLEKLQICGYIYCVIDQKYGREKFSNTLSYLQQDGKFGRRSLFVV